MYRADLFLWTQWHVYNLKKILKKLSIGLAGFILLTSIAAGIGIYWMTSFVDTPAAPKANEIIFTISPGQSLDTIARNLKQNGIITDPFRFKLYARYKKAATQIKAGEYQLSPALPPAQVLATLQKGRVKLYKVTIPEGLNLDETAALVQKTGFCSGQAFLTLCHDRDFIGELDLEGHTLEGYLYPDTYFFPKTSSCRQIIKKMTATFHDIFTPEWRRQAKALGYSVHEIVTLASIIEKETGDASERPLISSVFHNRLKKRMRLESDPTVIYGDKTFDGRIRYRHLRRKTPYNTYQIKGLPLGPIANPGGLALKAALFPVSSDYIFFVSKNDTTHYFSKTLKEHNRAVRKYQLNK